jgi:hypothetical protein
MINIDPADCASMMYPPFPWLNCFTFKRVPRKIQIFLLLPSFLHSGNIRTIAVQKAETLADAGLNAVQLSSEFLSVGMS